jgi:hypothetical protein
MSESDIRDEQRDVPAARADHLWIPGLRQKGRISGVRSHIEE